LFTVTTSGFPAPTIARGGVALPAGVTFVDNGNGTGTLGGMPAAGTGGTYALTFTATNSVGSSSPQNFTLTVSQPPSITSANRVTFSVGAAGTFTVTTTGSPVPAIARTGAALPAGITFVDNGNGTGTLSGTPAVGTAGTHALTFTAANGVLPDAVQSFTLNVHEAPAITSATATTFTVGTPGTFTVTTTGFPAPTVSQSGALPAGITFTPATRVLGGTATQTGAFPLVFTATNGVPPDATQNFTLNVVCPAITVNPAVLPDGLFQTAYGPVTFVASGSTGSTFTWNATGLPAGLAIGVNTGIVSGTPTTTVLNAAVVITATDNFGCPGTRNTTITVRPTTDNESYTGGVGHTQFSVGVGGIATPHVAVADNVKTGDNGPGTPTVTFPATSANGSIVEGATDGTFVYTPNLNFAGPSDSFVYTLTDGNGLTNTGTVTINLSNIVWYVNSSGGAGDGRSHNPFNSLASAGTASASNSTIYVHSGAATTPGNLTMDASQTLHGQGATFRLNGLTILAGTRPTLSGTVTLAGNNIVRAVNFTPSGVAMTASGVTLPVTIDQVNVTGGTNALSLTNVSGDVVVNNANFTNSSGAELLISGGTGLVGINSTVAISSNAGQSIDIQGRTTAGGRNVFISGPITDTGAGIFLDNNDASTIIFRGGLSLSTTTNPAFTATNGGTVEVCDENPCNPAATGALVNTITTTTGTALNVSNTTIGASGLTFHSISANGAVNGIVLNNTGATAGLTVTGDGNTAVGGNNSGGTIQNTTSHGISLTNTRSVSLTNMNLSTTVGHGVGGTLVNGFTFAFGKIDRSGLNAALSVVGAPGTSNIGFNSISSGVNNLQGVVTITGNTLTNAFYHGFNAYNESGTISDLTITNNVLTATGVDISSDGSGIAVDVNGSPSTGAVLTRATVSGNTINNFFSGAGIQIQGGNGALGPAVTMGIPGSATNIITITSNAIGTSSIAGGIGTNGIAAGVTGTGQGKFSITNNGTAGAPIQHFKGIGIAAFGGNLANVVHIINNNFIDASDNIANSSGMSVGSQLGVGQTGTISASITSNTISGMEGNGILAGVTNSNNSGFFIIQNNLVGAPQAGARPGIRVESGSSSGDTTLCLNISGNTAAGSALSNIGIGLRKQGTDPNVNEFRVVGMAATSSPGVEQFVDTQNTSQPGPPFGDGDGVLLISATSGFGSCSAFVVQ
jgi:Bacterial Ig domain/Putative Ig domain